jgi:serine/threonine protein kinase
VNYQTFLAVVQAEIELCVSLGRVNVGPKVFEHGYGQDHRGVVEVGIVMEKFDTVLTGVLVQHCIPYASSILVNCMHNLHILLRRVAVLGYLLLDIKPDNIVVNLDAEGNCTRLRIIDFGSEFVYRCSTYHTAYSIQVAAFETVMSYLFMFAVRRRQGHIACCMVLEDYTARLKSIHGVRERVKEVLNSLKTTVVGERLDGMKNIWSAMDMMRHYSGERITAKDITHRVLS